MTTSVLIQTSIDLPCILRLRDSDKSEHRLLPLQMTNDFYYVTLGQTANEFLSSLFFLFIPTLFYFVEICKLSCNLLEKMQFPWCVSL